MVPVTTPHQPVSRKETPANNIHNPQRPTRRGGNRTAATTPSPATFSAATEVFLESLLREATKQMHHLDRHGMDADDVAAMVCEKFLTRPEHYMERYRTPLQFARVATRHMLISFDRKERVQRSERAALERGVDSSGNAQVSKARTTISGNARVGDDEDGGEIFDYVPDTTPVHEEQVDLRLEVEAAIRTYCCDLTPRQLDWYILSEAYQVKATEIARQTGFARETVSREVNRARELVSARRDRRNKGMDS